MFFGKSHAKEEDQVGQDDFIDDQDIITASKLVRSVSTVDNIVASLDFRYAFTTGTFPFGR